MCVWWGGGRTHVLNVAAVKPLITRSWEDGGMRGQGMRVEGKQDFDSARHLKKMRFMTFLGNVF